MEESRDYSSQVRAIVSRVQRINRKIGNYEMHTINGDFKFSVKLDNGRLIIPYEAAQDWASGPEFVTEKRLINIANTFIPDNPTPENKKKDLSIWARISNTINAFLGLTPRE